MRAVETSTKAGGIYPTGMHSCCEILSLRDEVLTPVDLRQS